MKMKNRVIVYEDSGWRKLLPLVYMRGVFELRCGFGTLLERVARLVEGSSTLHVSTADDWEHGRQPQVELWCRAGLAEVVTERTGRVVNVCRNVAQAEGRKAPTLLLNGRGLWKSLPRVVPGETSWVGVAGEGSRQAVACIVADADFMAKLSPAVLLDGTQCSAVLAGLPRRNVSHHVCLFDAPWQLVSANPAALTDDWRNQPLSRGEVNGYLAPGSTLLAPEAIHIGPHSRVKPCVVIDAEDGPVWIGRGVTILPHCYVQGPVFIGDDCLLQAGTSIRAGSTVGPSCQVGGEIAGSILHGSCDVQHGGYLGHSYVGAWTSIAAGCATGDLDPVHAADTGEPSAGVVLGDYSTAGVNVGFPAGAVVGFGSGVFASHSPRFVPSFAWLDGTTTRRHDEHRSLEIARNVMSRRRCRLTDAEQQVFADVRRQALAAEHPPQWEREGF